MSIGKIGEFNVYSDDWNLYVERLEQYFIVNAIPSELHVPTLITLVGAECYELLVKLCTPERPKNKSFSALTELLEKYLQPKPNELAKRFKFRNRKQLTGETIAEYTAVLKKMSKYCKFGSWLQESLRDQLVCGITSETIRQRLFAETNLDFRRAYSLAVRMEAAERDAAAVAGHGSTSSVASSAEVVTADYEMPRSATATVASRIGGRGWNSRSNSRGRKEKGPWAAFNLRVLAARARRQQQCRACGANHDASTCRYIHYVCRMCNRLGHLRWMCPNIVGQLHVEDEDQNTSDSDSDCVIRDEML